MKIIQIRTFESKKTAPFDKSKENRNFMKFAEKFLGRTLMLKFGFYNGIRKLLKNKIIYTGKDVFDEKNKWSFCKIINFQKPVLYSPILEGIQRNGAICDEKYFKFIDKLSRLPHIDHEADVFVLDQK